MKDFNYHSAKDSKEASKLASSSSAAEKVWKACKNLKKI